MSNPVTNIFLQKYYQKTNIPFVFLTKSTSILKSKIQPPVSRRLN